jgi:hypothetical protein
MAICVAAPGRASEEPPNDKPTRHERNRIGVRVLLFATPRDCIQETGWNNAERLSTRVDVVSARIVRQRKLDAIGAKYWAPTSCPDVAFWRIVLQKSPSSLCEIEICNDRIGARAPLNRCCAFAPDLESMLRDKMLKILLQHNRHISDLRLRPSDVCYWGKLRNDVWAARPFGRSRSTRRREPAGAAKPASPPFGLRSFAAQ